MKHRLLLVTVLSILFTQQAWSDQRFIIRVNAGLPAIQQICAILACSVIRGIDGSEGRVFLVTTSDFVDPNVFLLALQNRNGVSNAEPDKLEELPRGPVSSVPPGVLDSRPSYFFGGDVWTGYAEQPSAQIIRLKDARDGFHVTGSGIVAVIDTGVDPDHPALNSVLVAGYDFTRDTRGMPAELPDLAQPPPVTVNGGQTVYVNDSTAAVVDDNTATSLRQYSGFGHGTMVSGVIHLVAPTAMIMPLKAFGANGTGFLSDILRAIYYAVQNGAGILNMSFSTPDTSEELRQAVNYATDNGAISVGSAGNDGKPILVYPAAFANVMGVASTDYNDQRSSFSNYGPALVWVAAPVEMIISTYPFSSYAATSGTSFSAPFVAGVAALLRDIRISCNQAQAAQAISNARKLTPELGNGRLDVYQAVLALTYLP